METESLIIDEIRESDREDYYNSEKELVYQGEEKDLTYYKLTKLI